jgi:pSer/pThr/pTyr-binding forkhead associated (FHA) protein
MLLNHPFDDNSKRATLVNVDDKRAYDLETSETTFIGRAKENDISLVTDLSLSRRHAVITLVDGTYYVRDLQSSNGTLLNGKAVEGIVTLQPDDEIFLGRSKFLFCPSTKKLGTAHSYVSEEDTIVLKKASASLPTRVSNFMLAFRRLLPAQNTANTLTTSMQQIRASHTNELLRGIQR